MRDEGRMSLPPEAGQLAVLLCVQPTRSTLSADQERAIFWEEAERIRRERQIEYNDVAIREVCSRAAIIDAIGDPEVAGLELIGHGSVSAFDPDSRAFTWKHVADTVSDPQLGGHLKLGHIVQRFCGEVRDSNSITWATFLPFDQRTILAPIGQNIPDDAPEQADYLQVYQYPSCTVEQINAAHKPYRPIKFRGE